MAGQQVHASMQYMYEEPSITDPDINEFEELPIFDGLEAPSLFEVGNIVNLTCGHAQRPSDSEANLLH